MLSILSNLFRRSPERSREPRSCRIVRGRFDAAQTTPENQRHWAAADGVDVDGAVARIKSMVRKAYQADLRSQAEAERTQSDRRAAIVREKVASMSLDAVREKLRSFAFGIGNAQPQAAAVAFFREKSADECSEEDLRSLLSDIMTAEESNAESEDTDSPETGR